MWPCALASSACFELAIAAVRKQIIGVACAHDTSSRVSASATRDVSMVIHRRPPLFGEMYAVVPDPQVGSSTRSPGIS